MVSRYELSNLAEVLQQKSHPTLTQLNRLEGRPRTADCTRALRAEVRDALWMLTRQWQTGELNGEDAGSPVFARLMTDITRLTRFKPGDAPSSDFDDLSPLEVQVECRPLPLTIAGDKNLLDLRLVLGRRWMQMIAADTALAGYAAEFLRIYKFELPDPTKQEQAAVCAHPEVWQSFAAVAGRGMDGGALYQALKQGGKAYSQFSVAPGASVMNTFDGAAAKFVQWVDRLLTQPKQDSAWQPSRLDYRFACAAPGNAGDKIYEAAQYEGRTLDWYDVDHTAAAAGMGSLTGNGDPRKIVKRSMIPAPVSYSGMPNRRWRTFEDSQTNFGAIRPDTTDIVKLLFAEFGLVYSNDWFVVPYTLPGGTIATIAGLAVTNVFGERFRIEAAGTAPGDDWQKWSMFTSTSDDGGAADASLLLLPTVPKVLESAPIEDVLFIRDEMADMVWGIEKAILAPDGRPKSGATAAQETRAYHERLVESAGAAPPHPTIPNDAKIAYTVMTSVPENWIPFISVRATGGDRATSLQRAAMERVIDDNAAGFDSVAPRTTLLSPGLDGAPASYLIPEEEVPRAGLRVSQSYRRTRWIDGRAFVWIGARKQTGRGEGSSGLAFDLLAGKPG